MKKLLGISLVAVLAATPLMANAQDVSTIAETGDALTTQAYVKGAYNALGTVINTKQDQLTNGTNDIVSTVKTVVATENASDTALVTESAVRNAITAATYDDAALAGRVNTLETSAAMNSGITAAKVEGYDAVKSAVENTTTGLAAAHTGIQNINNSDAMTSGITAAKVQGYDTVKSAVENATTGLAAAHTGIQNINSSAAMTSGITSAKVQAYDAIVSASGDYATKTGVDNTIKAVELETKTEKSLTGGLSTTNGSFVVANSWTDATDTSTKTFLTGASADYALSGQTTVEIKDSSVSYTTANANPANTGA